MEDRAVPFILAVMGRQQLLQQLAGVSTLMAASSPTGLTRRVQAIAVPGNLCHEQSTEEATSCCCFLQGIKSPLGAEMPLPCGMEQLGKYLSAHEGSKKGFS